MKLGRHLAFGGILLIGAALVAWWCVATEAVKLDSPFRSPDFRIYFLFALAGEVLLGLPYAFAIRALLKRFGSWSAATMIAAALLPGLAFILFPRPLGDEDRIIGPCMLIAGAVMAAGWHLLRFDPRPRAAHA